VKKVRVGVIGAGSWAVANHLPTLAQRPDVELVVVNRPEPDLVRRIQGRFGFTYGVTDYRQVLEHQLDVVFVCSPPAYHYEHAKAALESGAHVMCEKPFTLHPAEAWELTDLAKRRSLHLVVAYGWNYQNIVRLAKDLMVNRGVGTIESMAIQMASPTRELLSRRGAYWAASDEIAPDPRTWTDPNLSGGGYGQAQLTHALGLALWLTGLRGTHVYAWMSTCGGPVELHDAILIRYDNQAIGTLFGASCPAGANKHQLEVRIYGSDGQLIVDVERALVWWFRSSEEEIRPPLDADAGVYDGRGPTNAIIDLALGKPGAENCSPPELAARVVEILHAAYRSYETNQVTVVTGVDSYTASGQ
jgi:predicted dehydrogenase